MVKNVWRGGALVLLALALSACGGGGGSGGGGSANNGPMVAANGQPTAHILASGDARAAGSGVGLSVTVGGLVRLDGSTSSDADKDALTYEWSLTSKPAGSAVTIATPTLAQVELRPDVMGAYVLSLKVTDTKGAANVQQLTVTADNREPVAAVVMTPSFTATPTDFGSRSVTVGASITLDASTSTDPDGDPLTISYEWVDKPPASVASLAVTGKVARFVTDQAGRYQVRVRGQDGRGASFEALYAFSADNRVPVASISSAAVFTPMPLTIAAQAVTVGAPIVVDASGSTDPDGDAVSVGFTLLEKPAGSSAQLTTTGKRTAFTTDALGFYRVLVRGSDARGASFETTFVYEANNRAPNPVVVGTATVVVANAGTSMITTSVGYDVLLTASGSDPDGDAVSYAWEMSRPIGSASVLAGSVGTSNSFSPDGLGVYLVTLTATDSKGAKSVYKTNVQVTNRRPSAQISSNASPQALPYAPTIRIPLGSSVTLRGGNSTDPDGDALTYGWTIDTKPSGSTAMLANPTTANPTITPDVGGAYIFRLRVTDTSGAFSERALTMNVGNTPPTVQLTNSRVTIITGSAVTSSAAWSFDSDGDSLTYAWTLDVKPAGSTATIATPNQAQLSLTPDVVGTYLATVSVSDGRTASTASVEIRALSAVGNSVSLGFKPVVVKYSAGLDKLVTTTASPSTLRIVDPFTGATTAIPLPWDVKSMSLSPDGKLAVVLYDGKASLVDLATSTLLNTFSTAGTQTDAVVDNAGIVWALGSSWASGVTAYNGRTSAKISQTYPGSFYSSNRGALYLDRLNKILSVTWGVSPVDIIYLNIDPAANQVTSSGDSPYHGTYSLDAPLFLSQDQSTVFTVYGSYYETSGLTYMGTLLPVSTYARSIDHSNALDEVLLMITGTSSNYTFSLPSSYKRYTGSLFIPQPDLPLPLISGSQAYGLYVFHSATGKHIVVVQTGSATPDDAAASYHVLVR